MRSAVFLSLGHGYNFQLAYITRNGFGIDLRYVSMMAEFNKYGNSILQDVDNYTLGLLSILNQWFEGLDVYFANRV